MKTKYLKGNKKTKNIEKQINKTKVIMNIQKIQQYKADFDLIVKTVTDDDGQEMDVWYARELQQVLGYSRWENFATAIGRAMQTCKTLGVNIDDHFREVTKMITLAKGALLHLAEKSYYNIPCTNLLGKELLIDSECYDKVFGKLRRNQKDVIAIYASNYLVVKT